MCLYARDLTPREGRRLSGILKSATSATYLRRGQVVAFSGQGMRVQEIAERLFLHEEYVRELIRKFNQGGFDALRPTKPTGSSRRRSAEAAAR